MFPVAPPSQGSQAPPPQFGGGTQNQYPKPVASAPPTGGSGTAGAQSQQVTIPVMVRFYFNVTKLMCTMQLMLSDIIIANLVFVVLQTDSKFLKYN